MRYLLLLGLLFVNTSAYAIKDVQIVGNNKIIFDTSVYNIKSNYKKATIRALITRDWIITSINGKKITAKLKDDDYSPIEIDTSKAPIIHFRFTDANKMPKIKYLLNLKRDMLDNLLSCSLQK